MRIALLSDSSAQTAALRALLLASGHIPTYCQTLERLVATMELDYFDALVASYDAPDERGLARVEEIRDRKLTIPLILITPHQDENYVVRALNQGVDDYMTSPVRQREFLARLEALVRRAWQSPSAHPTILAGRLQVNFATRRILLDSILVPLSSKDFDLAVFFLNNVDRLIPRERILQAVWGRKRMGKSRTLDTHVSRLRKKLKLNERNGWKLSAGYLRGYRLERLQDNNGGSGADKAQVGSANQTVK